LINLSVSLIFLLILLIWAGTPLQWSILFLPGVMMLQFFWLIALGMWLSTISVFIRDLIQILPNLLVAIMFMTPIFYSFESMPLIIQKTSAANPFYQISEAYRATLLGAKPLNWAGLTYVLLLSSVVFGYGLSAFRRAKGYFDSAL